MDVVIADHESSERATLVELCHSRVRSGNLIVVETGTKALEQIRAHRPEVALIACDLKDMTGFDVLRALNDDERPATIMVAPDDRYAAEAMSLAASDYLTRPISPDRLAVALQRARVNPERTIRNSMAQTKLAVPGSGARFAASFTIGHCDRLVGERAGRIYFLPTADIDYIEADSNYVEIHVGNARYLNRDSLTRLSTLLESAGFVRISRAIVLNLHRVSFAEREGGGVLAFVLQSGARVQSSTGFRLEAGTQLRITRTRGSRRKSPPV